MATMDIIKLHGGNPANFLDIGGGAEEEGVRNLMKNKNKQIPSVIFNSKYFFNRKNY